MADEIIIPPRRFTVLIDSREKEKNRLFTQGQAPESHGPICAYEVCKVDAGDYAIKESPYLVCIEKKQDGKELYTNLMHDRERMSKLFTRMQKYKHRWIIFQQTYEEFCDSRNWRGVHDPWKAMSITEGWLIALIEQQIYFHFAGKEAARWTRKLLTKKYDEERKRLRELKKNDD